MTSPENGLHEHRVLIDACLRNRVPFWWRDPGTLLISVTGIAAVRRDVLTSGWKVIGLEGFELEGSDIHPRLDLIFDSDRRPDVTDVAAVVERWPREIWVDV